MIIIIIIILSLGLYLSIVVFLYTECDVIRGGPTTHRHRSSWRPYYKLQRVRQLYAGLFSFIVFHGDAESCLKLALRLVVGWCSM